MNCLGKIDLLFGKVGRSIYSIDLDSFDALASLQPPTGRTIMLLAADATGVPVDSIDHAAEHLLASGLVYICAWGGDCERVHDIFDEVFVGDGSLERELDCMTTWHADDTLEEAVSFFINCARPCDGGLEGTAFLAVTLGNQELGNQVSRAITTCYGVVPS